MGIDDDAGYLPCQPWTFDPKRIDVAGDVDAHDERHVEAIDVWYALGKREQVVVVERARAHLHTHVGALRMNGLSA